ncbi:MAG: tetratricopeptide repeat protein [Carboxylicivirga sp.]|nr:tetratricopeptide repeat protein [Carboxylicivirga sp.]
MRAILLLLMMGFFQLQAQDSESKKLIKQGQALFAHQLYEDAINKYKHAITLDKKCIEAHFELAYTYLTIKDDKEALYYCRNVMSKDNEYWLDALLIYGAILNNKEQYIQAVREYKKALKKYPNESLLHFNIAKNYLELNDVDEAEKYAIKSLQLNKQHIAGHKLLSNIMKRKGDVLKSMLPIYYALFIEVDEAKRESLLEDLQVRWHVAMVQKPGYNKPVSKHSSVSGLKVAESKLNAIARETSVNNPEEPFKLVSQTIALLSMLNEEQTGEMDFFDIHYVDFFKQLHLATHTEAYCYFICSSKYNPESLLWIGDNKAKFNAFINWMELQQ